MGTERSGQRKKRTGVVVSNGMNKSVVVAVERLFRHPIYKKVVRSTRKFMAHDEENACGIGDKVVLEETRPLSKCKRWRVVSIVERATLVEGSGKP
ncbi:MAG: 30S ribosomal protein S17 [Candidatus Schekmanbacteria bacterium]|nr:30S ribosomal protein S17 [Candidatus Schekmanbacteria bacterium]